MRCSRTWSPYALFQDLVSADGALHVATSFAPVMMTIIGGVGSFFGPIAGAAIFGLISELTSRYTERVELVVGLILIAVIMYFPFGFMGAVDFVRAKWQARRASRGLAAPVR
jgi:branched-chain amino acid transport system permease protein